MKRFLRDLNVLSFAGSALKAVRFMRWAVIAAVVIFAASETVKTAAGLKALKGA